MKIPANCLFSDVKATCDHKMSKNDFLPFISGLVTYEECPISTQWTISFLFFCRTSWACSTINFSFQCFVFFAQLHYTIAQMIFPVILLREPGNEKVSPRLRKSIVLKSVKWDWLDGFQIFEINYFCLQSGHWIFSPISSSRSFFFQCAVQLCKCRPFSMKEVFFLQKGHSTRRYSHSG